MGGVTWGRRTACAVAEGATWGAARRAAAAPSAVRAAGPAYEAARLERLLLAHSLQARRRVALRLRRARRHLVARGLQQRLAP